MIKKYLNTILISALCICLINGGLLALAEIWGVKIAVQTPQDEIERAVHWRQILPESLVMPVAGVIILGLLRKFNTRNAYALFSVVSVLATIFWSIGPLQHGVTIPSKVMLTLTHFVILFAILTTSKLFIDTQ